MRLLCLIALLGLVYSNGFDEWTKTHGKVYGSWKERVYREAVWNKNQEMIRKHNVLHMKGEKSYTMGMNAHGDLTYEEFRRHKTCMKKSNHTGMLGKTPKVHYFGTQYMAPWGNVSLPDEIDFRTLGFVTQVKDQGQCGSCWAFSTTGSIEGQIFRATGELPNLSEQQLVDCSQKFGNYGCDGGLMDQGFLYTMSVKGLESEDTYPYTAEDGECQYSAGQAVAAVTGYMDIPSGSEDMLTMAIALNGPVSIGIDAGNPSFQFYSGGVYDEPECSSVYLDHGVLAVGYGVTNASTPYYLVKNSWGESWGVDGYIMMSRNGKNQCGVATSASFPLV